jgi:hypothetical protein
VHSALAMRQELKHALDLQKMYIGLRGFHAKHIRLVGFKGFRSKHTKWCLTCCSARPCTLAAASARNRVSMRSPWMPTRPLCTLTCSAAQHTEQAVAHCGQVLRQLAGSSSTATRFNQQRVASRLALAQEHSSSLARPEKLKAPRL